MSENYQVGYGKPPQLSKWKLGQSGNPKGRPKGSKNLSTIMRDIFSSKVAITKNGQKRRVPFIEAFGQSLAAKGLHGTARDQIALLKAIHDFMPEALQPAERAQREKIIIEFVQGREGRPYYPDDPEKEASAIENDEVSKPTEIDEPLSTDERENGAKSRLDEDALEAAWRASGIDDEPETGSGGSASTG